MTLLWQFRIGARAIICKQVCVLQWTLKKPCFASKKKKRRENQLQKFCHIIIIIFSLTAKVVGAPQMISQPVSSIFPCSLLPSGTWKTPGLSIPWCCLPTSSSVCLIFFPPSLCLARWVGQTWWTGDMSTPLQFASFYSQVFVWSDCPLDLGTDFLLGNMVFVWDV